MNKSKTHSLLVRGVSKPLKNVLKSEAKKKRQSVNSFILTLLETGIVMRYYKIENENIIKAATKIQNPQPQKEEQPLRHENEIERERLKKMAEPEDKDKIIYRPKTQNINSLLMWGECAYEKSKPTEQRIDVEKIHINWGWDKKENKFSTPPYSHIFYTGQNKIPNEKLPAIKQAIEQVLNDDFVYPPK